MSFPNHRDGSLDRYQRGDDSLWVFEREFRNPADARSYHPPSFVTREVTGEADFSGAALAERFGTLHIH